MENNSVSKYTISFGLSLALNSVINALLVVAKEKNQTVMAGMQKITGNQWVTHSAIVVILFVLLGWLFARANNGQGLKIVVNRLAGIIVAGVVAGGLIITGFYLIAD
jgi:heme/copper-type cytochrome/quinol oxidase subunit 4